ncbi:hypothetical protein [Marinobacterium litorale]|uniref:hypothetical protein n=1 Tax=Marinobacterium litorale TaxID=404770 RepID=UPI001B7FAADC|nr:hypothetical protein [Marinobacterium litorale]
MDRALTKSKRNFPTRFSWVGLACGVMLVIMASTVVHASSIRFDNGRVHVREGSPVTLLLEYMGEPAYRSEQEICLDQGRDECRRWGVLETWRYHYDERNWTIKVFDGVIREIEWSRF